MKPLSRALKGEAVRPPPVWLMRQAGRYLPEYRALRAGAKNFVDFCLSPDLAAEATLQPIRRFGLDGAILFADILLVPHALGQPLAFLEGEGPKLAPVRTRDALDNLTERHLLDTLAPVMETVRRVRAALPPETTLIGFAGAPWTIATYMIEGEGGTDFSTSRQLAWHDPSLFDALLTRIVSATTAYLIAQIDAGAEALQLFDSWAGAVPAAMFETAVIRPTAAIVSAVKAKHPNIPIIGFPRGAGAWLGPYAERTGVDAVGVDQMTDMARARAAAGRTLQGNLDPVLLREGGLPMRSNIAAILEAMRGHPFIFNLGHGVFPDTPPEHVFELVQSVRASVV